MEGTLVKWLLLGVFKFKKLVSPYVSGYLMKVQFVSSPAGRLVQVLLGGYLYLFLSVSTHTYTHKIALTCAHP